jgi:hypothetical protein
MYLEMDERVNNLGETIMEYAEKCLCFTRQQAYYMRPLTVETSIDYVLQRLVETRMLKYDMGNTDRFILNSQVAFDYDKVNALWVLLTHKGERILGCETGFWIAKGRMPYQISYIFNNTLYDVMTVRETNKMDLVLIEREYKQEEEDGLHDGTNTENKYPHKYIFVIDNEDVINKLPLINVPHLFAVVDGNNVENPVDFIEDGDDGFLEESESDNDLDDEESQTEG